MDVLEPVLMGVLLCVVAALAFGLRVWADVRKGRLDPDAAAAQRRAFMRSLVWWLPFFCVMFLLRRCVPAWLDDQGFHEGVVRVAEFVLLLAYYVPLFGGLVPKVLGRKVF